MELGLGLRGGPGRTSGLQSMQLHAVHALLSRRAGCLHERLVVSRNAKVVSSIPTGDSQDPLTGADLGAATHMWLFGRGPPAYPTQRNRRGAAQPTGAECRWIGPLHLAICAALQGDQSTSRLICVAPEHVAHLRCGSSAEVVDRVCVPLGGGELSPAHDGHDGAQVRLLKEQ